MKAPLTPDETTPIMNSSFSSSSRFGMTSKSLRRFKKASVLAAVAVSAAVTTAQALVITTNTLTISPTGTLNLKSNNLIVNNALVGGLVGAMYNGIQGYVQTGLYNGPNGYWDGPGIDSSVAAADLAGAHGIGVLDNGQAGYATWPPLTPQAVSAVAILIKYTYFGDADLDGAITPADYQLIDASVGVVGTHDWLNGDFDYDGSAATPADYQLIDAGLAAFQGGGPLTSQGSLAGRNAISFLSPTVVPEPSSIGLLSIGILTLARRSRRKEK